MFLPLQTTVACSSSNSRALQNALENGKAPNTAWPSCSALSPPCLNEPPSPPPPSLQSGGVFSALKAVAGPAVKAVIPGGATAATVGMGLAGATLAAAAVAGAVKAMKNDDDDEGEREREGRRHET